MVPEYARDVKKWDEDTSAIFIDIFNNINEFIRERMMIKENWSEIFKSCDVVALLGLVDTCHGHIVDLTVDDSEARMIANNATATMRMRSGQSVSDFKKSFEIRSRFKEPDAPYYLHICK